MLFPRDSTKRIEKTRAIKQKKRDMMNKPPNKAGA